MIDKTQVIQTLQAMPERFSLEDLIDKLLLINKIEIGLQQSEENQTLSHEEAKDKLKKWL